MTQWGSVGSAVQLWLSFQQAGLKSSIQRRGFWRFIFSTPSVWLTLQHTAKIGGSLDMTTVLLPSV